MLDIWRTYQAGMRRYAFCMVFHVRWIFLTKSLRIPPESRSDEVGFGDEWWEIHLTWKTIQNAFSRIFCTLRHFNQAKYTVQSCRSWKPCEMDLSHNCSLHGECQKYATTTCPTLYLIDLFSYSCKLPSLYNKNRLQMMINDEHWSCNPTASCFSYVISHHIHGESLIFHQRYDTCSFLSVVL